MWLWVLQNGAGESLSVLSGARSRGITYKRSSTPEAHFELDLEHDDAAVLEEALSELSGGGLPLLRAFRVEEQESGGEIAVCRFCGPITSRDEQAGAATINVVARGAFEVLEGRFTDAAYEAALTPGGEIVQDVITINEGIDGLTGLTYGTLEVTEAVDVSYEPFKRLSEVVSDLADGFDFEVVPLADDAGAGTELGRLDIYASQGTDRPAALFGYGEGTVGNCTDASRTTLKPVNKVYVTGVDGLFGYAEDAASIAAHGVWTAVESMSDVDSQDILDARAQGLLVPAPQRAIKFTPDPTRLDGAGEESTPKPWDDYWLGDTVRASVRKGSFQYDGAPRIDGIAIEIDDQGFETSHELTFADETASE